MWAGELEQKLTAMCNVYAHCDRAQYNTEERFGAAITRSSVDDAERARMVSSLRQTFQQVEFKFACLPAMLASPQPADR